MLVSCQPNLRSDKGNIFRIQTEHIIGQSCVPGDSALDPPENKQVHCIDCSWKWMSWTPSTPE